MQDHFKLKGVICIVLLFLVSSSCASKANENIVKVMSTTLDSSIFSIKPSSVKKFYSDSLSAKWLQFGAICSTTTENYTLSISFTKNSSYHLEMIIVQTTLVDSTTMQTVKHKAFQALSDAQSNDVHPDGAILSWTLSQNRYLFLFIEKQSINKYKLRATATTQLAESDY